MHEIYKLDDRLYYVYEHWLDGEVIYVGKGIGGRALSRDRNSFWLSKVMGRYEDVEIMIKAYFREEEDALDFEGVLINRHLDNGAILTNIKLNHLFNGNTPDEYMSASQITHYKDGHPSFKRRVKELGFKSKHKFNHISQVSNQLKDIAKNSKVIIFANSELSQEHIFDTTIKWGFTPLILCHANDKEGMIEIVEQTGIIPEPYNVLILNEYEGSWTINDEDVNSIIINSVSCKNRVKALNRINGNIESLIYKTNEFIQYEISELPKEYIGR